MEGINEIIPYTGELLEKFYFGSLQSYIAFICFLIGLFLVVKDKRKLLVIGLASFFAVFAVFIVKTGSIFPTHTYYIIPFTPLMALITGYALTRIPRKFAVIILALICVEGVINQQHDFFVKDSEKYLINMESVADSISHKDDLIVINGGQNPQQMYFTNRHGWSLENEEIMDSNRRLELEELGAN